MPEMLKPDMKALVWLAIGLYAVPFVSKYIRAWKDKALNE
jgi:hypothetical protein